MNNTFNINRFGKLIKQQYQLSGKSLGLALASIFIGYSIILLFFTFKNISISAFDWVPYFLSLNVIIAVPFAAYAFPAFRSKVKTFDYLLLPSSVAEKFTFNVIVRIIAPWIILPVIFYVSAHVAAELALWYNPQASIEAFSLSTLFKAVESDQDNSLLFISVILLGIINQSVLFTGAAVFKKHPLVKTLVTIGITAVIIFFYFYIIIEWAEIFKSGRMPWFTSIESTDTTTYYLIGLELILLITTLAFAFFKVKEKEIV